MHNGGKYFWISVIYARSKDSKIKHLWNKLRAISNRINGLWTILGDFNSILKADEKKGGIPPTLRKSTDFITCKDDCGMFNLGYTTIHIQGEMVEGTGKESVKGSTWL